LECSIQLLEQCVVVALAGLESGARLRFISLYQRDERESLLIFGKDTAHSSLISMSTNSSREVYT
jgi:hypothetical protein